MGIQSRRVGHKKRKLDSAEQARLYSSLDRNPFTTNQQLRARVGNKIAASTVSRYLTRAKPPFTAKVAQDQEPEELTEDWKEEARKWLRGGKTIAMRRRIYADEAPIYANEAPHKGRSRKGKPIICATLRDQVHAARLRKERSCGALGLVRQERTH